MIFTLKNIGKITSHELNLNNINIIAGQNDTAKSTIGKSLFALFTPNMNSKSDQHNNLLVKESLNIMFNDSFLNVNNSDPILIELKNAVKKTVFKQEGDQFKYESNDLNTKVIYIDSLMSKLDSDYFLFLKSKKNYKGLNYLIYTYDLVNSFNVENQNTYKNEIKYIKKLFNEVYNFNMIVDGYYCCEDYKIPFNSLASGIKNMYYVYKLVCNGQIDSNTILILDEPEDNLHPDWQLKMAEIIVKINEIFNCTIIITTHSSEQIESILTIMLKENQEQKLSLFTSHYNNDKIEIINHGNDPYMQYEALNSIYDKLDEMSNYEL